MRLTIFNGSPKHGDNNTSMMINEFVQGFSETAENEFKIFKLNALPNIAEAAKIYETSDYILLAFPLYVYSMPAGVKEFIEALEPMQNDGKTRKLGFLVQYGFQEAIHARPLEKYLKTLAVMLNCEYLGTIIKGGCDGLARSPQAKQSREILQSVHEIGAIFGKNGKFDAHAIAELAKPEIQKPTAAFIMKLIIGLINKYYWGGQLKKNGALGQSFNKPYGR